MLVPPTWTPRYASVAVEAGFAAVATSAAPSPPRGAEDADVPPDEAFGAVARIAGAVDVPVTADMEAGYGWMPPSSSNGSTRAPSVATSRTPTTTGTTASPTPSGTPSAWRLSRLPDRRQGSTSS